MTAALALRGDFARRDVLAYILAQIVGALSGVVVADLMFDLPLFQIPKKVRTGIGQWTGGNRRDIRPRFPGAGTGVLPVASFHERFHAIEQALTAASAVTDRLLQFRLL